jgi:hypothetical protein
MTMQKRIRTALVLACVVAVSSALSGRGGAWFFHITRGVGPEKKREERRQR